MADMKVVSPTNGEMTTKEKVKANGGIREFDPKAMKIEEEIVALQETLAKKKYRIKTTTETFDYLLNTFYKEVKWEGYECYAISETHKEFSKISEKLKPSKTGKVGFSIKPEILEATFHFVKKHNGTGLDSAKPHRLLCEDLSVTMAQMNEDRKELRELAMEAEAAKHGITVEDYKKAADAMHAQTDAKPNIK